MSALAAFGLLLVLVLVAPSLVFLSYAEQCSCADVIVHNRKLYVGGQEFYAKGVAYSPTPLGIGNNTGLCSWRLQVFGEMAPDCYGSDFFRWPAWHSAWERDLPLLAEAGFNTIRIYNMEFLDVGYAQKFKNVDTAELRNPELAADHRPFMDLAHKYGMKVIVPVVEDATLLTHASYQELEMYIEGRVNELGGHPALLMWAVANEIDMQANPGLLQKVNWSFWYLRKYTMERWNRRIPTTYFTEDYPPLFDFLMKNLKWDVAGVNTYRGLGINTLFYGDGKFAQYTAQYNVPLLIGEWSVQELPRWISEIYDDVLNRVYKDIVLAYPAGCIGAVYFQALDDISKPSADEYLGLLTQQIASNIACGSTDNGCFFADGTSRKPIVFDSLKSGLPNSLYSDFNINADIWELNRRYGSTSQNQTYRSSVDPSWCSPVQAPSPNGVNAQSFDGPQYGSNILYGYTSPYLDRSVDACGRRL